MAGKSYKLVECSGDLFETLSDFYSELEALADEAEDVRDSIPESLQGGERYQAFDTTSDTLRNITCSETELEGDARTVVAQDAGVLKYHKYVPRSRRDNTSRMVRLENACITGRAALNLFEEIKSNLEENLQQGQGASTPDSETQVNLQEVIYELDNFIDQLASHVDEAEGCEFPGMYG